jgi:putative hydrolase of the HAD superfamily
VTVEAVVFDADGVVTFKLRFARLLAQEHAITPKFTRPFFRRAFEACVVGQADLMDVLPPYLAEWGWPTTVDEFITLWLETDDAVDERVVGVVGALRAAGHVCCLATTQERHRAAYMRDTMGFGGLFDHLFFSCEIGCSKPSARFYAAIEERLGLKGESILFFDDDARNVEAARARGWRAEVYVFFQEFVRDLNAHLRA